MNNEFVANNKSHSKAMVLYNSGPMSSKSEMPWTISLMGDGRKERNQKKLQNTNLMLSVTFKAYFQKQLMVGSKSLEDVIF